MSDWWNSFGGLGGTLKFMNGPLPSHETAEGEHKAATRHSTGGIISDLWLRRPQAISMSALLNVHDRFHAEAQDPKLAMNRSTGKVLWYPRWKRARARPKKASSQRIVPKLASKDCKAKLAMKELTGQRIFCKTILRDLQNTVAPASKGHWPYFSRDVCLYAFIARRPLAEPGS